MTLSMYGEIELQEVKKTEQKKAENQLVFRFFM